jgi:hypothetical protein
MKIKEMREAVDNLRIDLGEGLLATDIYSSADGQSIYGFNSQPKVCALFNQVTALLITSLKSCQLPTLGKYYIVNLADGKMVLIVPLPDYQWAMIIDTKKLQTGLLLNVVLPDVVKKFEDALAG